MGTRTLFNRYLTHDEFAEMPVRDKFSNFRFRVWQGEKQTAIVLVSATPGGKTPFLATTRLANYANGALMRHNPHGMLYFQYGLYKELFQEAKTLAQLHFGYFGNTNRLRLYNPSAEMVTPEAFCLLVGAGPIALE